MQTGTLCYPVDGDRVLLIHKKTGLGSGMYNGPGGKVEPGETPREAAVREVREEVGLDVTDLTKFGELEFHAAGDPLTYVHVYRSTAFSGEPEPSREADPEWHHVEALPYDEMWDGDRHWLPHLLDGTRFSGTFRYVEEGGALEEWELETGVELG